MSYHPISPIEKTVAHAYNESSILLDRKNIYRLYRDVFDFLSIELGILSYYVCILETSIVT